MPEAQDGVVVLTRAGRDVPEAAPFVLACWLESYKPRGLAVHGLDGERQADQRAYYQAHHPEFTRLLRSSTLAIAHVEGEPDVYAGWALGGPGLLHYVFVKGVARHHDVGRRLVRAVAGERPGVFTFEPSRRDGRANAKLLAVAERHGWRFHPHPVPGMQVRKQREDRA